MQAMRSSRCLAQLCSILLLSCRLRHSFVDSIIYQFTSRVCNEVGLRSLGVQLSCMFFSLLSYRRFKRFHFCPRVGGMLSYCSLLLKIAYLNVFLAPHIDAFCFLFCSSLLRPPGARGAYRFLILLICASCTLVDRIGKIFSVMTY